ncbi:amino acid adenylation domain-containing protein [Pedobacter sp. UYP1]
MDQDLFSRFHVILQQQGVTLFMGLLAAVNALLYRYSGQEDIIIGSPVAGREHIDLEDQIGFYVNTLALRTRFTGEDNYHELLQKVKEITLGAYEHQSYPFDQLIDELNLQRDLSRSALFDIMVVLDNNQGNYNAEQHAGDLMISHYKDGERSSSKFDLTFNFMESADTILLDIEYNNDIYEERTINQLAVHFEQLLSALTSAPSVPIRKLAYLNEQETEELLFSFNATDTAYRKDQTVINLFEKQVILNPDTIAVAFLENTLSYHELNELSNKFGNYLREHEHIHADELIGICLERSEWLIIVMLGILKSGAAYVPIDPAYPQDRKGYMLSDSQCKVLVDENYLEAFRNSSYQYSQENLKDGAQPSDLAYVIYTSGSTGKPKGVMIEHRSVNAFLNWCLNEFKDSDYEVVFGTTSICFDLSIFEIFYTLISGKKIRLLHNALSIGTYLIAEDKILLNTVPSVVGALLSTQTDLSRIKILNMAGEPIPSHYINKLDYVNTEIRNLYGPSEDTTYSTSYLIKGEGMILIGKPIANTAIYILNEVNQLQALGGIGEICISGDGLARGYLNQPELTAEKFISHPYSPEKRIYKTGDLGRWLPDGNIVFLGRKDDQVKIHGYRIELSEIESALYSYADVDESIVIAKTFIPGEKEVIAYVVSKNVLNITDIRAHLSKILPAYMLPVHYIQVDALPLLTNGKIDKKALPDPVGLGMYSGVEYAEPRNETEKKLVQIWNELLNKDKIGIKDNFFDLGGHSLKVVQLTSRISMVFALQLNIQNIFEDPTIEGISGQIDFILNQEIKKQARDSFKEIEI